MALSAKLEFRQGQQLVMTPQLQQAIRLLQLSNIELNAFVEAELESNPLLEREEARPERGDNNETKPTDAEKGSVAETGDSADLNFKDNTEVDYTETFDTAIENVYPEAQASDFGNEQLGSWASVGLSCCP